MGNYVFVHLFINSCLSDVRQDHAPTPPGSRDTSLGCTPARLLYDAGGPCSDVARRTSRPSPERRRGTSGRVQSGRHDSDVTQRASLASSSASAARTPRDGLVRAHFAARKPAAYETPSTTIACMTRGRGSCWCVKFNFGV